MATILAGWDPGPPPETVLFSPAQAWDLVSLTKPFSQFVVVHMNIHGVAHWALLKNTVIVTFCYFLPPPERWLNISPWSEQLTLYQQKQRSVSGSTSLCTVGELTLFTDLSLGVHVEQTPALPGEDKRL